MIELKSLDDPRGKFSLAQMESAKDLIEIQFPVLFQVEGRSMYPALRNGDVVELGPARILNAGDLIVFRYGPKLICHRVYKTSDDGNIVTQGDRSGKLDDPIREVDILGKVESIRRGKKLFAPFVPGIPARTRRRRPCDEFFSEAFQRAELALRKMIESLKKNPFLRNAFRLVLSRHIKYYLARQCSLQTLKAYEEIPVRSETLLEAAKAFLPVSMDPGKILLIARVNNISAASLNLGTQEIIVRRLFSGLGIEDNLKALAGGMELCQKPSKSEI